MGILCPTIYCRPVESDIIVAKNKPDTPDDEKDKAAEQKYKAEDDGGMMKESGKYKYEAKSSSKSKSSSGVAVVPVCLPLCCGLPCAIL